MDIDETAVCRAFRAFLGDLPASHGVQASPVRNTSLWFAGVHDEQGRPYRGAAHLVGPDLRIWSLSSNPLIHDLELAVMLLDRAYREEIAGALSPDAFGERVRALTESRREEIQAFVADLKAGELS